MKRIDEKRSGQAIYKEFLYIISHIWIDLTSVFRSSIHVKLKVFNGRSMSFSSFSLSLMAKALFGLKKWSLITQFSLPITHHSVFITHHSSFKTPHFVWHHHSFVITQYFSTICGPHTCTLCNFYIFHSCEIDNY